MELFAGIFELLGAIIELFLRLVWLLFSVCLRALGRGGLIDEGKARKRVDQFALYVILPLMLCSMLVLGVMMVRTQIKNRRIKKTRELVTAMAAEIVSHLKQDENFRVPDITDTRDSWGNALTLEDKKGMTRRTVTVVSMGPDETLATQDDIEGFGSFTLKKHEIGKNLLDRVKNAVLNDEPDDDE